MTLRRKHGRPGASGRQSGKRTAGHQMFVRLVPRAGRDEVAGFEGEVLRVRVKAPPVEGRANEAVLRVLANVVGVPRSSLTIVRGRTSRNKIVAVEGLEAAEARRRIERGGSEGRSQAARAPTRSPGQSPGGE